MEIRTLVLGLSLLLVTGTAMASHALDQGVADMLRGNDAAALKVFRPLATKGNAEAQYYMGYMYQSGTGVPVNKRTALQWYDRAAAQGHNGAKIQAEIISDALAAH